MSHREIMERHGLPPLEGTVTELHYNTARSNWGARTEKGWFYCRTLNIAQERWCWESSPYNPWEYDRHLAEVSVNPIYVSCHMCHASIGVKCRWHSIDRCMVNGFHDRRARAAYRCGEMIDTAHALAHGKLCKPGGKDEEDICRECGQLISRLESIPEVLKELGS